MNVLELHKHLKSGGVFVSKIEQFVSPKGK